MAVSAERYDPYLSSFTDLLLISKWNKDKLLKLATFVVVDSCWHFHGAFRLGQAAGHLLFGMNFIQGRIFRANLG